MDGALDLARAWVRDKQGARGGAISCSGVVSADGCTFVENRGTFAGGALYVEFGASAAPLDCVFLDNDAPIGGAISNSAGTVTVEGTWFDGNDASGDGGAIFSGCDTRTTIRGCRFTENSANRGGALFDDDGDSMYRLERSLLIANRAFDEGEAMFLSGGATILGCLFEQNVAVDYGGAIQLETFDPAHGRLRIRRTCFFNNFGIQGGGVIHSLTHDTSHTITISECGFRGNAGGGSGGGVFKLASAGKFGSSSVLCTASTFSQNGANGAGGSFRADESCTDVVRNGTFTGGLAGRGGVLFAEGAWTLEHVTIADNRAKLDATLHSSGGSIEVFASILAGADNDLTTGGGILSLGYNITDDAPDWTPGVGDVTGVDPLLSLLGDNGGPTPTIGLLIGSPAVDPVPVVLCTLPFDQRGEPRPLGAGCDAGAVEQR